MTHKHSLIGITLATLLVAGILPASAQTADTNPKLLPRELAQAEQLTREAMAQALLQSLGGPTYTPPACVQGQEMFNDVPFDSVFCPWIEELARRGITGGCGNDNYCPGARVSRSQMAAFIVRAQFPTVVPAGLTLTGHWGFDADSDGTGDWGTSISYPVPMPTALTVQYIGSGDPPTSECQGSASLPTAAPGFLCIYEGNAVSVAFTADLGGSRFGTNIYFLSQSSGDNYAYGTWAATAPL